MTAGRKRRRGQVGLERLMGFLLLAILVVAVVPAGLGIVGIDLQGASSTGAPVGPAPHQGVGDGLQILDTRGHAIDEDRRSIGAVTLLVTDPSSADTLDLADVTAVWIHDESSRLVHRSRAGGSADGRFLGHVVGERDSATELGDGDRGRIVLDLGTDDVDGVDSVGRRLRAGEFASVVLELESGERISRDLHVPEDLPANGAVNL